jgi:PGF-CTERM protein
VTISKGERRRYKYIMNRKPVVVLLLLALIILVGVPESFARPQYLTSLTAVYGAGSCGTCHIRASGGGPRNSYGTLFEDQPNHATDPGAALTAIGPPPTATLTPTATSTTEAAATLTETPPQIPASTPIATETPAEPATPDVTTVTATVTPAAPGFGIVVSLVGLFVCALLVRRNNK